MDINDSPMGAHGVTTQSNIIDKWWARWLIRGLLTHAFPTEQFVFLWLLYEEERVQKRSWSNLKYCTNICIETRRNNRFNKYNRAAWLDELQSMIYF